MKTTLTKILMAGMFILLVSCNQANKPVIPEELGFSSDTLEMVNKAMQAYIDSGKLSCISVMLVKDGVVVYDEEFGFINIENKVPNDDNTIFRIFSMTKPVTAVALMILYEEGKFDLDDKVHGYIPEFSTTMVYTPDVDSFTLEPQSDEITIRHLLTHTSGIVYGWDWNSYVDSLYRVNGVANWDAPIGEKVKLLAGQPLKFQPGTKWEYGLSIDVAGYLVEIFSGLPLDEFMKTRIFDPLGMEDTDFFVPEDKHNRFADLYFIDELGKLQNSSEAPGVDFGDLFNKPTVHFSGGGGLVSTAGDYLKFCSMLLNGGQLDGVRILEESTVDLIMSNQLPAGASYREGYGYGLAGAVNLKSGEYSWAGAAATNFWIDPSNNMVIMAYTQLMPSDHRYAYEFRDIVLRALNSEVD